MKRTSLLNILVTILIALTQLISLPIYSKNISSASAANTFYSIDMDRDRYIVNSPDGYETTLMVAALQGIVNRNGPKLWIYRQSHTADTFGMPGYPTLEHYWKEKISSSGEWLEGYQEVKLDSIEQLLTTFPEVNKVVIWDPDVGATANVATTIAGVEGALPVRFGSSLYNQLVIEKGYEVVVNLKAKNFADTTRIPDSSTPTTGSSKNNAYIWAKEQYLDTGKTNPQYLGLTNSFPAVDAADQVSTRDIIVMNKGFDFDLCPWTDETPIDDQTQALGTDRSTLIKILETTDAKNGPDKIAEIIGYPAWWDKCTNYGSRNTPTHQAHHEPVALENEMVKLFSEHGIGMNVSEHLAVMNTSFHIHSADFYREKEFWQDRPAQLPQLENKTYILFEKGDYDGIHAKTYLPDSWENNNRQSTMPITWSISPIVFKYMPDIAHYIYTSRGAKDGFGANAGNCLYIAPNSFTKLAAYGDYCKPYYSRMDQTTNVFAVQAKDKNTEFLNTFAGGFTGDGIGIHNEKKEFADSLFKPSKQNTPLTTVIGLPLDANEAQRHILYNLETLNFCGNPSELGSKPCFIAVHGGPQMDRAYFEILYNSLRSARPGYNFEALDQYTYFSLLRKSLGDNSQLNYRASYNIKGLPQIATPGQTVNLNIKVRNNGEVAWQANSSNPHKIGISIVKEGEKHTSTTYDNGQRITIDSDISRLGTFEKVASITVPTAPGTYTMELDIVEEGVTWFRQEGNAPFRVSFVVQSQLPTDFSITNLLLNYRKDVPDYDLNKDSIINGFDFVNAVILTQ